MSALTVSRRAADAASHHDGRVFLLVPAEGQLRPKDFLTLTMKPGETRELEEMKALGLEPLVLVVEPTPIGR